MPVTVEELQKLVLALRGQLRDYRAEIGTLRLTVRDLQKAVACRYRHG